MMFYFNEKSKSKKTVIINESVLPLLVEDSAIRLQLINGYFYPTDSLSADILSNEYHLGRIPKDAFDRWSPKFVHDGHKLAITGYEPQKTTQRELPRNGFIGEPKSVQNPCLKCKFNDLCDSDDCGMKNFRLFKK